VISDTPTLDYSTRNGGGPRLQGNVLSLSLRVSRLKVTASDAH
jgi:hypothetical protein